MTDPGGRFREALVAAAALVLAVACTGSGSKAAKVPTTTAPPTIPAPTTTVAASPRTVVTLPAELGPGPAHVAGTVSGPGGGVVAGATVRVERLVDDATVAATTVETGADGHWAVDSVNGGRYRLRAWKSPDLAQLTPVLAFVTVENPAPIDLPMLKYPSSAEAVAIVVPNPPVVGQPATLVVTIANGGVDSEGVLQIQGRPGVPVFVGLSANVAVKPPDPNDTDANGNAGFIITCTQPGPVTGTVTVAPAGPQPIQLPACTAP